MAKSLDDNIQALSRSVLDEAKSKAEQILADARAKAEAMRQRAKEQADTECRSILERASREAERIRGQAVAAAQLKARTQQLIHREKLIEEVFDTARQRLSSVQQRDNYQLLAAEMLREALQHLSAETARVRADARTNQYITIQLLDQVSTELKVKAQAGQPLAQELGVIAETLDGHRRYDNTLQTRLNRIHNSLRAHIYDILTGKAQ